MGPVPPTPSLHDLLLEAAKAPLHERVRICGLLRPVLERLVPAYLKDMNATDGELEAAIDHLIQKVQRGSIDYRGDNAESSARCLVRVAARRKVLDLRRRSARLAKRAVELRQTELARHERAERQELLERHTRRIVPMIVALIEQQHPESAKVWKLHLQIGLERIWEHTSGNDQLVRHGYLRQADLADSDALRRARNRLDQHCRRGRALAGRLLQQLVNGGRVAEDEAQAVARYNRFARLEGDDK